MAASVVTVVHTTKQPKEGPRPAHHRNDTKNLFVNPWPSYQDIKPLTMAGFMWSFIRNQPRVDKTIEETLKLQTPTWGKDAQKQELKATWLGHACFLVELPTPEGAKRGPRILFDPVFSHRCSPFSFMGPARYTRPPVEMNAIPKVDIVVISHNHYDHMDAATIQSLRDRHNPHFFAPLNNDDTFVSFDIAPTHFHCLDWWENNEITVELPIAAESATTTDDPSKRTAQFRLTCTPCQHQTARGMFDRFHTLWSSWAVEELVPASSAKNGFKIWFGGDTGYRHVSPGQDENQVPVCPAFKEIGEKFGGFDLALIPIGAYNPRELMSSWHASPSDSVRIFQDIKAKKALAMHWGTWVLTIEPVLEPPKLLAEEAKKAGLADDAFTTCGLGETVVPVVNRRKHLPSEDEARKSLQLIDEWKSQIATMKQEINVIETALRVENEAHDLALEQAITGLRNDHAVRKQIREDASQKKTRPVLSRLEDIEARLRIEQEFMASVRKMPDELLVEIFTWYWDEYQVPTRRLALVCKRWRLLIINTPFFWRNITVSFVDDRSLAIKAKILQRRIELSRSTLLNVALIFRSWSDQYNKMNLFELLAATGVERWRSLEVEDPWRHSRAQMSFEGMFSGDLTALKVLKLTCSDEASSEKDPLEHLHQSIIRSKPRLEEMKITGNLPQSYHNSSFFQHISKLQANTRVIGQMRPMNNLQQICITDYSYAQSFDPTLLPPLPAKTVFRTSLNAGQLQTLQRNNVEFLELSRIDDSGSPRVIDFPELKSLSILNDGLRSILRISAPKLANLRLTKDYLWMSLAHKKRVTSEAVSILQDATRSILLKPTTVTIDIALGTTAMLTLLQHWPQIQHLSLSFGSEFLWKGTFATALTRRTNPILPHLITLIMDSKSPDFKQNESKWKKIAETMLTLRKSMPLRSIEWRCDGGQWQTLTRV